MMLDELYKLSWRFSDIYYRKYQRSFKKKYSLNNRFSIIIGPKGVGKTTAIIQYLLEFVDNKRRPLEAIYIQADHFMVGQLSLYEIADSFVKEGGKLICFDEIHKYPDWSRDLKSIYDSFPELKIIASGSSALEIYRGSHDLSRRAIIYKMPGLSFREFIELSNDKLIFTSYNLEEIIENHQDISDAVIKKIELKNLKILPLFRSYLQYGYYPYFQEAESRDLFYITLEQSIHAIIENDLIAVFPGLNGTGLKKIKKLLSFIAESVPFIPDLKKMKKLLGIGDERTLKTYLNYLEKGGVINSVSKKGKSLSSLEKPEKIFLHNTNLMYAITSNERINTGNIRETFFVNALMENHDLSVAKKGDFIVNEKYIFEIGGKSKKFNQIKGIDNSFLALDEMERGIGAKIPLWLFGFLY